VPRCLLTDCCDAAYALYYKVTGPYFETPYAKAPSATVDGTTGTTTATGTAPGSRGNAFNKTKYNADSGSEADDDEAAFGRRVRAGRPT
jgi:hypothetical protein